MVVIGTEKLTNSEAKSRCYDNFEGDNNRVVFFLNNQYLLWSFQNWAHSKLYHIAATIQMLDYKFIKLFPSLDYEFITTLLSPMFT